MSLRLKRARDEVENNDGYRVLVDRLWPRGLSRDKAAIDLWLKDAAPTAELRQAFHDGSMQWPEFRRRYLAELKSHKTELRKLAVRAGREPVTLVFGSRDRQRNNAVVLKEYLHRLGAP